MKQSVFNTKNYNPCQAREKMQPVPSAGKQATRAKRGRENMQPARESARKASHDLSLILID